MKQLSIITLCLFVVLSSCRKETDTAAGKSAAFAGDSIYFAKGFRIETYDGYTLLTVRNPWKTDRELQRLV